jgi:hypothetical protein
MNKPEIATKKVMRSITFAIILRNIVPLLAGWLFIWGTAILILRAISNPSPQILLYGVAGLPATLLAAAIQARRQIPSNNAIRAKLDSINHDGGMLITTAEADLSGWIEKIIITHMPTAHWRNPQALTALTAAIIFLGAACLTPIPHHTTINSDSSSINGLINNLQAQIELLDNEELIDSERSDSLHESIDKISEQANAAAPMKTWEAIDNVANSIDNLAQEAADNLTKTAENAAAMQSAAKSLQQSLSANGPSPELSSAMQELSALLKSKNILNAIQGNIPHDLAEALKNTKQLSPEQLKKLAEALKQCQNASTCKINKLCKASLIDPEKLAKCKSGCKNCDAALAAFLTECQSNSDCQALIAVACPGKGAANRGRGDAAMTWTDGTDENNTAFKDQLIQPSSIGGLDKTRLTGISKDAPQAADTPIAPTGGSLAGSIAGGGGTHKQQILPQHKQTVRRYFHRED